MNKYIDAGKLIAEIKIIQRSLESRDVRFNQVKKIQTECLIEFCKCIIDTIYTLQQEQPEISSNMIKDDTLGSPDYERGFKHGRDYQTNILKMKIQYKSQPLDIKSEKRYLRYRIDPSELSWWKRTFKNPWRYAYTAFNSVLHTDNSVNDCLCFLFSQREANEFVSKYDTYEKLIDFLITELNKAKSKFYEAQEKYRNENNWKI